MEAGERIHLEKMGKEGLFEEMALEQRPQR